MRKVLSLLKFPTPEEMEDWFLNVLDSIYDGILIADVDTVVQYVNPEYTRITGVRREEIVGRLLSEVRPGAILPSVIRTGEPRAGVYRREGAVEYVVDMAPILCAGRIVGGVSVVKDITEVQRLTNRLRTYARRTSRLYTMVRNFYKAQTSFTDIVAVSPLMRQTLALAQRLAESQEDVLITGPSGTGKELFAQAIHNASPRAAGPFVPLDCPSINPALAESELFGYEEGAFTGARKGGRLGLFEVAEGGTIFLDEIADLQPDIQAKLLRVLQQRRIRRVGDSGEQSLDVRVIAATNKDLLGMVAAGTFREDLYYRLNVLRLQLPPLRNRREDIAPLAETFLAAWRTKTGRVVELESQALAELEAYAWPGNVRELKHAVEFAANICQSGAIDRIALPRGGGGDGATGSQAAPTIDDRRSLRQIVADAEREAIQGLLLRHGRDLAGKRAVARRLGISLATLYNKLRALGLES
ncbi:MAG: sigma 54-interacting transcriptional regulator [Desulfarculus sp.]|nr:sigma 54-interacting transcriptional regulator [Desulfarculus sp.]